MAVSIERATVDDAQEILALQKLAYLNEAAIYDEYGIPPLTQSLEELQADFMRQVYLKAAHDGRIIGSVRAHEREGTCFVGRLIVHPDSQNRGIGSRLMEEIEAVFAQAGRFELFTGHRSERNLYLYQKLGYRPFRREQVTAALTLVYLEKTVQDIQS
ncbi:MAG: GNAT family N-acetyltransferase [Anaerolineae bacterium]|jgi:GNAT superfamily N-acetyltransferase